MASPTDASVRKPYTNTKSRESWTDEEHDKFLEALQLFDRDWKKIEDFVGTKTVIQDPLPYFCRSAAMHTKGTMGHVPPPRPKRKSAHPYPHKVLVPLQPPTVYSFSFNNLPSGYCPWDDTSALLNSGSSGIVPSSQDEFNDLSGVEGDAVPNGFTMIADASAAASPSSRSLPGCEVPELGKQTPVVQGSTVKCVFFLHTNFFHFFKARSRDLTGIPDFAEVYNFIGSVFDPETKGHLQKLKEMDPIHFETVLLLMRNLTVNLSSPDFEAIKTVLASSDAPSVNPAVASVQDQDIEKVVEHS